MAIVFFFLLFLIKKKFKIFFFLLSAIQAPPARSWLRLASPNTTQPTAIFTIMNYNILGDKYATRHIYGYCPSWALKWDYRRKQILEELRSYSADIIALQVR
jgi:CCR4-NOT transcription complex subunit 6